MDICIQNVARPMVCSIVKGHRDSNEVPAGKITSPLCLDRHLPMSEQVSCSRMETLHLGEDGDIMKNGTVFCLNTKSVLSYQVNVGYESSTSP